ncbi:LOW QUALITY PROTEIN: hypothetical protein CRUP_001746 [Coryphaenoides rupestris]|nr:LOW QUALITY PROTEIN: hypothetical protein CRUP_001746 [Coryphaenoides rupestris]
MEEHRVEAGSREEGLQLTVAVPCSFLALQTPPSKVQGLRISREHTPWLEICRGDRGDGGETGERQGETGEREGRQGRDRGDGGDRGGRGDRGDGGDRGGKGDGGVGGRQRRDRGETGETEETGEGGETGETGETEETGEGRETGESGETEETGEGGETGSTGHKRKHRGLTAVSLGYIPEEEEAFRTAALSSRLLLSGPPASSGPDVGSGHLPGPDGRSSRSEAGGRGHRAEDPNVVQGHALSPGVSRRRRHRATRHARHLSSPVFWMLATSVLSTQSSLMPTLFSENTLKWAFVSHTMSSRGTVTPTESPAGTPEGTLGVMETKTFPDKQQMVDDMGRGTDGPKVVRSGPRWTQPDTPRAVESGGELDRVTQDCGLTVAPRRQAAAGTGWAARLEQQGGPVGAQGGVRFLDPSLGSRLAA